MSGRPLEELAKEAPSSYLVDMLLAVAAGSAGAPMPARARRRACSLLTCCGA